LAQFQPAPTTHRSHLRNQWSGPCQYIGPSQPGTLLFLAISVSIMCATGVSYNAYEGVLSSPCRNLLLMMRRRCHSEEVAAAESPPTYWRATDEESPSARFDRITTIFSTAPLPCLLIAAAPHGVIPHSIQTPTLGPRLTTRKLPLNFKTEFPRSL
jgi:hypothetical protein